MHSTEIATVTLLDQSSQWYGVVIIRCVVGRIGLTVSLREDGDVEVFLKPTEAAAVIEALQSAMRIRDQQIASAEE